MKQRMVPLLLIVGTAVALVLNARGHLVGSNSVSAVLFVPDGPTAPVTAKFGAFALAFFLYWLAISGLSDTETEWLTGVIVLGALYWNQTSMQGQGVIGELLSALKPGDSTGAPSLSPGTSPFQIHVPGVKTSPSPVPTGG